MSAARTIRRIGIFAAAGLLTMSIAATPLYAVDSDNPSQQADSGAKKKAEQKSSKAKVKKPAETTSQSVPESFSREPPHGTGY